MNRKTEIRAPQWHALSRSVLLASVAMGSAAVSDRADAQQSASPPAAAQPVESGAATSATASPDRQTLESVTVTARKRDEKQIDVPISVQAFSEREIRAAGIYSLHDLQNYSGFNFLSSQGTAAGGRTFGVLIFRGLAGDSGQVANAGSSGAVFIDGIFVSGGVSSVNTVDVARVEVLKGPQNAFFGRSTFGGAINYITRNPSMDKLTGVINTSFGSRGSNDEDVTLEGPLAPGLLSARLNVANHVKADQYHTSDGGGLGGEKTKSVTGTLYATPTDKVWLRFRAQYQQDDDSAAAIGLLPATTRDNCRGLFFPGQNAAGASQQFSPIQPYFCGSIPTLKDYGPGILNQNTAIPANIYDAFTANSLGDPFQSKGPDLTHSGMRRDTLRLSAQAGVDLPYDASLAVNVGYNRSNSNSIWDLDRSPVMNFMNELPVLTSDLTFDTRLSSSPNQPLRGLIGLSYFHSRYRVSQIDLNAAFGATAATLNLTNYVDAKSSVPAAYASVEYDILKQLTASIEARYQIDKSYNYSRVGGVEYRDQKNDWLPRATLRYKPTDEMAIYANIAKGVQPLLLNAGYINAPSNAARAYIEQQVPGANFYSPQPTLVSTEIGMKQTLLNDRVQYAIAGYNEIWRNRITSAFIFNPLSCTAAQALTPACPLSSSGSSVTFPNDAHIKGVELSVDALLMKGLQVGAYFDFKNPRWQRYYNSSAQATITGATVGFNGNTVRATPKWNIALNGTYRAPVFSGWDGYVRGDVFYTGTAYDEDFNVVKTDAFFRANFRAGVERQNVTVEAYVKNAFDDKHWDAATRTADLTFTPLNNFSRQGELVVAPDRREVGIRLRYAFN